MALKQSDGSPGTALGVWFPHNRTVPNAKRSSFSKCPRHAHVASPAFLSCTTPSRSHALENNQAFELLVTMSRLCAASFPPRVSYPVASADPPWQRLGKWEGLHVVYFAALAARCRRTVPHISRYRIYIAYPAQPPAHPPIQRIVREMEERGVDAEPIDRHG